MTAIATPHHRVSVATAHVHAELDAVADAPVWSMDPAETAATLQALVRAEARVAELTARVAAHADEVGVGAEGAAASTGTWLAVQTRQTRSAAHATVKLGRTLEEHEPTRAALAAGDICVDQARVILRWVDDLPDDLDQELRRRAEDHLLSQAAHYDAKALNQLGKHLFEVIAPEEADAREAEILAREEAAAAEKTRLSLVDDGHGVTHVRGAIPTFHGAALRKILDAIIAPKHQRAVRGADDRPERPRLSTPQMLGQAFCELIERYPVDRLPETGGLNATVVALIDYDALTGRVEKAGLLDTGQKISPALARRLVSAYTLICRSAYDLTCRWVSAS